MPVALEFCNIIFPIATIRKKYPGGWEQCLKDNEGSVTWYDEHLFRMGAMNPMDIESIAKDWEKMGFTMTEKRNGQEAWKDFCVAESDLPCPWLAINSEKWYAYLEGTDPCGLVYGPMEFGELRVIGAMIGDIAGSPYERRNYNIKYKPEFLIDETNKHTKFTDDTVLTYAVALGMIHGMKKIDRSVWMGDATMQTVVEIDIASSIKHYAKKYPRAGYGRSFEQWFHQDDMERRDSFGNGSAMRASFAGWYADSLEEAELLGKLSASFTHGHPEGIKGAVVVAGCIYLLITGRGKEEVREYASKYYDLNFTLDEIRPIYKFDTSCAGSVPQAIAAFLEEDSFEDVVKAAISIGGDSDTIAAIAGSIAEAYYPIPRDLRLRAWEKLDSKMKLDVRTVTETLRQLNPDENESDEGGE